MSSWCFRYENLLDVKGKHDEDEFLDGAGQLRYRVDVVTAFRPQSIAILLDKVTCSLYHPVSVSRSRKEWEFIHAMAFKLSEYMLHGEYAECSALGTRWSFGDIERNADVVVSLNAGNCNSKVTVFLDQVPGHVLISS